MKELIGRIIEIPTGEGQFIQAEIIEDMQDGNFKVELENGYKHFFSLEYIKLHLKDRPKEIKIHLGSTYSPEYQKLLADKKEEMKVLGYKLEREEELGRDFNSEITFRLIEDWELKNLKND